MSYNDPNLTDQTQDVSMTNPPDGQRVVITGDMPDGTSPWVKLLVIGIALVVIFLFVFFLIRWATSGDFSNDTSIDIDALLINGVNIGLASDTAIQATWTSVGDPGDVVTLYVNQSGDEMKFSRSGRPLGSYKTSTSISVPIRTAIIDGLVTNASYDAVLVVTNPKFPNPSNANQHESGLTPSSHLAHGTKFTVQASNQKGQINYQPFPTPTMVSYTLGSTNPNQSLFHHDADGFICATTQTEPLTATSGCDNGSYVLYSTPGAAGGAARTNNLSIIQKSQLTTAAELATAKWQYNANNNNEWCLTNGAGCMLYDINSPPMPDPTTSFLPLTPGNQPIFVAPNGSKWDNNRVGTATI